MHVQATQTLRPQYLLRRCVFQDICGNGSPYLYLTSHPALVPHSGLAAHYYQRVVLDYCVERVVVPKERMGRAGASSTGRRHTERGVAVAVVVVRLAGGLGRLASSAGGSS